jgi:hypothetical protein
MTNSKEFEPLLVLISQRFPIGFIGLYVGTKMSKFPLPVMDMPVCVLGSVRVLSHAFTGTGICMYGCIIIHILFCFSYHFTYLPP